MCTTWCSWVLKWGCEHTMCSVLCHSFSAYHSQLEVLLLLLPAAVARQAPRPLIVVGNQA